MHDENETGMLWMPCHDLSWNHSIQVTSFSPFPKQEHNKKHHIGTRGWPLTRHEKYFCVFDLDFLASVVHKLSTVKGKNKGFSAIVITKLTPQTAVMIH